MVWNQTIKSPKYTDKRDKSKQGIHIWLEVSKKLDIETEKTKDILLEIVDENIFNCRQNCDWVQRPVVLSFYYLLRF